MWKNRNLRSLKGGWTKPDIRDFTTTPLPIPKIFLVVYLLKLSSECLVSYDPHFPANDGTKNHPPSRKKLPLERDVGLIVVVHVVVA